MCTSTWAELACAPALTARRPSRPGTLYAATWRRAPSMCSMHPMECGCRRLRDLIIHAQSSPFRPRPLARRRLPGTPRRRLLGGADRRAVGGHDELREISRRLLGEYRD